MTSKSSTKNPLKEKKKILKNDRHTLYALCGLYFKDDEGNQLKPYKYQLDILEDIVYGKHKKTLCWATTRAGKSLAVALGIILRAILSPGERIRIIAPTLDHTRIVMNYVIQHIFDSPELINNLNIDAKGIGIERLKKQLTKQRITFKNKSEIMIITADISGDGRSLLGFGGTLIVVDECESIPSEIIRSKVMRMLGDRADSQIFLISNPTQAGFMYDKMKDNTWHQLRINWRNCVSEGRLTEKFVMERAEEMGGMDGIEFTIWYKAEYPKEFEDTLIPWKHIEAATARYAQAPDTNKENDTYLGVDVASMGADWTVFTSIEVTSSGKHIVRDIQKSPKNTTMWVVGKVIDLDSKFNYARIIVDSTGLGTGVVDRLQEQDIGGRVVGVNFGAGVDESQEKKRYLNCKSEMYWNLKSLFESSTIYIPHDNKLVDQLSKMRFEFTSSGKIRIIDPETHSPDEADSLALANYIGAGHQTIIDDIEF